MQERKENISVPVGRDGLQFRRAIWGWVEDRVSCLNVKGQTREFCPSPPKWDPRKLAHYHASHF